MKGNIDTLEFQREEIKLAYLADILVNADAGKHRIKAHSDFYEKLLQVLSWKGSFNYSFDSIKWVSIQYPEDKSFRIFSWQLKRSDTDYSYYTIVQIAGGSIYDIKNDLLIGSNFEFKKFDSDQYFSQLVYDIIDSEDDEHHSYLIFGYIQQDQFTKVKIVDVLTITGDKLQYGSPIFDKNQDPVNSDSKYRIVLNYSSDAMVSLVYNPGLDMIVFDHLIRRAGRIPRQGPTFLPDGSYEAFKRERGKWVYVEKLYDQILNEAPRPIPIGTDKTKDLFGRKKG